VLGHAVIAFAFTGLYVSKVGLQSAATGLSYGIVIGILCVGVELIRFAVEPLTTKILWMWVAGDLLEFALMGALVGDLRPSAREAENHPVTEEVEQEDETPKAPQPAAAATNRTPLAVKSQTVKSPVEALPPLSVKSLIRNKTRSSVTLQSDNDSRILFLGDSELVHTATGPLKVRFDGLTNEFVLLTVGEQQVKLPAR